MIGLVGFDFFLSWTARRFGGWRWTDYSEWGFSERYSSVGVCSPRTIH